MLSIREQKLLFDLYFQFTLQNGYLSTRNPVQNRCRPGSKCYQGVYQGGQVVILDDYLSGKDLLMTSGHTVIYLNGSPVWHMIYLGHYEKEALPTLKDAIRTNIVKNVFMAGRGPKEFHSNGHTYYNECDGDFADFLSEEQICDDLTDQILGAHQILGGWMVKVERK